MSDDQSRIVKDPICGKDVDTLRARAVGIFGGVTYYFCSAECKSKFVDPRQEPRESVAVPRAAPTAEKGAPAGKKAERTAEEDDADLPVRYARSRVRRVTGDVGTPVVQIDLSPNRKSAPVQEVPPDAASDEALAPARGGRGWAWIAIVMLIIAGGVLFFTLKHR